MLNESRNKNPGKRINHFAMNWLDPICGPKWQMHLPLGGPHLGRLIGHNSAYVKKGCSCMNYFTSSENYFQEYHWNTWYRYTESLFRHEHIVGRRFNRFIMIATRR